LRDEFLLDFLTENCGSGEFDEPGPKAVLADRSAEAALIERQRPLRH
jgi:hypothetical protein